MIFGRWSMVGSQFLLRKGQVANVIPGKAGGGPKKMDSCPFGFAQGRLFAGMTNTVSLTENSWSLVVWRWGAGVSEAA